MRASATILALLLVAGTAVAQDSPASSDYSKDTLQRLFANAAQQEGENPIRRTRGALDFNAFGTSWRLNYVPRIMMAMHGTLDGVTNVVPDPFALTGTQIATSPRSWRTRREINRELRRIEATERAKIRVTTR
ncbi:MAG TPA: hypothetical protein VEK79_18945 [Thermoanaerobaculia bacterium]|nr:hypothetical protein [Thermoanaerobaculia bacterium]